MRIHSPPHCPRRRRLAPIACAAALLLGTPGLQAASGSYRATEIVLPSQFVPGATFFGADINNLGQVTGTVLAAPSADTAFRWSPAAGFELLYDGWAHAINDQGVVAGAATVDGLRRFGFVLPDGSTRAVTWNGGLGLLPTPLGADGLANSAAYAINNSGQVLAQRSTGANSAEWALHGGGQSQVVPLPWVGAGHGHLNGAGTVLGGLNQVQTWSALAGISDLSGQTPTPRANGVVVNDLGVIAGSSGSGAGVFRLAPNQSLQTLTAPELNARVSVTGMNRDGDVVGYYQKPGDAQDWTWTQAVMWRADGALVNLNSLNVVNGSTINFSRAWDVNDRGQILTEGRALEDEPWRQRLYVISECLTCGQILPTPNPAGQTLDVGRDWYEAFNAISFENFGRLQLGTHLGNRAAGAFTNHGELNIGAPAGWVNDGRLINGRAGLIVIAGSFENMGAPIVNHGIVQLPDSGVVALYGGPDGGWLNEPGSTFAQLGGALGNTGNFISNRSTLRQAPPGSFTNRGTLTFLSSNSHFAGRLNNYGELDVLTDVIDSPTTPSQMVVRGSVRNFAGATALMSGGAGTVVELGGQWVNEGRLTLQGAGTQLLLRSDGSLSNTGGRIQLGDGSKLVVASDGGRLLQLGGALLLAHGARLELNRSRGLDVAAGRVSNDGVIVVRSGASIANSGSFQVQTGARLELDGGGSFLQGAGELLVAAGASVLGAGMLEQIGGTTTVNGSINLPLSVFTGGTLGGSGVITGQVSIQGAVDLRPGNSPGTLTIDGDLFLNGATLHLELGSGSAQDRLAVTGRLVLDTLNVVLSPHGGYLPDLDDSFDFVTAGSVEAFFPTVNFDTSALGGRGWLPQLTLGPTGMRATLGNYTATELDNVWPGQTVTVASGDMAWGRRMQLWGRLEVAGSFTHRVTPVDPADAEPPPCCDSFYIAPGGTLAVQPGGRFSARTDWENEGEVINAGRTDSRAGTTLINRGSIVNQGDWHQDGTLDNWGPIRNQGRFVLNGTLTDHGAQIRNDAGGRFEVAAGAVLQSFGGSFVQSAGASTVVDGLMSFTALRGQPGINVQLDGGELTGTGRLSGMIRLGTGLSIEPAGAELGTLFLGGGLTLDGARLVLDIAPTGADLLDLGQAWIEPGAGLLHVSLRLGEGLAPQAGQSFTLLHLRDPAELVLGRVSVDVLVAQTGGGFQAWTPAPGQAQLGFSGADLTYQIQAVPEPGTWALLLGGLGLLANVARRRSAAGAPPPPRT